MKIAGRLKIGLQNVVITVVVLAILMVTLMPSGKGDPAPFSFALTFGRRGLADGILNFFLFLPLGISIGWSSRRTVAAGLFGLGVATAIELVQMVVPGRDPALSDIVFNSAGTLAGVLIAVKRDAWLVPSARSSVVLTASSIFVVALVMVATAFLLSPLPGSPLQASRQFHVPTSPGDRPQHLRALLVMEVPPAEEPVLIARSGNDLLLRYPSRAGAYDLDQPEYWSKGAFLRSVNGETRLVTLSRDHSRWRISIGSNQATLGPTVGQGWAILAYPDAIGRRWGGVVSAAWMVVMFLPIGFWARGRLATVAAVVLVLLVALIPEITSILATSLIEWAGAVIGFLGGAALEKTSRRRLSHSAA